MRWRVTYKNDNFGFLTFVVTSPSCLNLSLCPLCNTNTLRNILMTLVRNVEQDEMMCCVQEWQRWLSYFWTYLPFWCLNLISCTLCNTLHKILMILNVEQDKTTCHLQEWQPWWGWEDICFFFFFFFFFCFFFFVVVFSKTKLCSLYKPIRDKGQR